MRISLIDFDSKIPNLALMQISSYHKSLGDIVDFKLNNPDIIYISCIFKKNASQAKGIKTFYPNSKVIVGGSGINYNWLPKDMQKMKPDYDLYPSQYSMGFTSRGCIRNCEFCIVHDKEGSLKIWQHPKEFHDDKFDTIMIMDNNWLASPNFFETSDWIIDQNLKVIEHGMDIRILTKEKAKQLKRIKFKTDMKFAFDNLNDEMAVKNGIDLLKSVGINVRQYVRFYVLVGFNTTPAEDKYRCRLLKEYGTNAFVMKYKSTKWTNKLARWANRMNVFWTIDIDEYDRSTTKVW